MSWRSFGKYEVEVYGIFLRKVAFSEEGLVEIGGVDQEVVMMATDILYTDIQRIDDGMSGGR